MFPIFKLPIVALQETLDIFEFQDLVLLSFCSAKTCQILKTTRSMKIGLELHADCGRGTVTLGQNDSMQDIVLGAVKQDHPCLTSKGTIKIRGMTVSIGEVRHKNFSIGPLHMATFWNDPILGFQTIMEYLQDLFRIEIHTIVFGRDTFWIVDWIQERQNAVQRAYTKAGESLNAKEYDQVMKTCKAKELVLNACPLGDFKYTGGLDFRECIHIAYGMWITLENLLEINAPDVYVKRSELTNKDVNQLLKKWLAGGLSKLKFLKVWLIETDAEVILHGMNVETKPGRTYYRKYGWPYEFKDHQELQRSDGATASIEVNPHAFTFAVWPDCSA